MNREDRLKVFKKEVEFIKNKDIRKFAEEAICILPDYFFVIPSSSTGKYHPQYALGEGGLLRHVKACVIIALELFRLDWWHFTEDEKDLILVALMLHDGWKSGIVQQQFSVTEHPILASQEIQKMKELNLLPAEQVDFICDGIITHMGQWVFNSKTHEKVLEEPVNKYQKFIHLVDYIASRKCLEVNFEAEVER